ncbi:hypothetical protein CHUAL_000207 [Chamberlinius hualienensis]
MSDENLSLNEEGDETSGDELLQRPMVRWAPLGANDGDDDVFNDHCDYHQFSESEKLRHLEEDQEQLNSSLLALTSHFAQVQFRLKQIVDASADEKENLLKDLEEFAFRGIPDTRVHKLSTSECKNLSEHDHEIIIQQQREKQKELIEQLKNQLEELETYAFESGEADDIPQSMMIEKQKVIIDELKGKLPLDLDQFHQLSPEQLRKQVERAISQLISPVKMKEQLVSQLKTQITDLERFIEFLQGGSTDSATTFLKQKHCTCNCKVHSKHLTNPAEARTAKWKNQKKVKNIIANDEVHRRTMSVVKRAITLLQMFIVTQFGCGIKTRFQQNLMKQTVGGNHWGDLRARLEVAISNVTELASAQEQPVDSDYTSDSEEQVTVIQCNEKLTSSVRKNLSLALRDLLHHGLYRTGQSTSLVPFIGCFAVSSDMGPKTLHIWELILMYYEMKNGRAYNATPARRLSQSFNLEIVGGQAVTIKQTLLGVIDNIISTHSPFKRSYDSHFKAFVCAGLNQKRIIQWLRLLLKTRHLVEQNFQSWSYVSKTGFEDAFVSLEKLNQFNFDLPVDLAVRSFQNIKDVF